MNKWLWKKLDGMRRERRRLLADGMPQTAAIVAAHMRDLRILYDYDAWSKEQREEASVVKERA